MKVKVVIACIWLVSCTLNVQIALGQSIKPKTKPNILFLFADDWGAYASCYRNPGKPGPNDIISTPTFDWLAKSGVLLPNTFTSVSSCTPSRGALVTGRPFYSNAAWVNLAVVEDAEEERRWEQLPKFTKLLYEAGYHVGLAYKTVDGAKVAVNYGAGGLKEGVSRFDENVMVAPDRRAKAEAIFAALKSDFQACVKKAKLENKPFLFVSGPNDTHRPWTNRFGRDFWGLNPDDLKGKLPAFWPDVPEVREDLADYLAQCLVLDRYMKEYLDVLRENGLLENTLIIATGDNGIPGFARGKTNCYDLSTQQGMIVRWPGGIKTPGRVVDDLVSLTDIAPTFYEIAGIPIPKKVMGHSFLNLLTSNKSGRVDKQRQFVITGRERHVWGARDGNLPYPMRAYRDYKYLFIKNFAPDRWPSVPAPELRGVNTPGGDFDKGVTIDYYRKQALDPGFQKYMQWAFLKRPGLELYDILEDPDCLNNLALQSKFTSLVDEYEGKLISYLKRTEDRRVIGGGSTFDKPPFTTPKNNSPEQ